MIAVSAALLSVIVVLIIVIVVQCVLLFKTKRSSRKNMAYGDTTSSPLYEEAHTVITQDEHLSSNEAYAMTKK